MSLIKRKKINIPKVIYDKLPEFTTSKRINDRVKKEIPNLKDLYSYDVFSKYSTHHNYDQLYNERELFLFNHKGYIIGYLDDDFESGEHVLGRCAKSEPKGIILGDWHLTDFEHLKSNYSYDKPPNIQQINGESLLGRQLMLDYFKSSFPYNFDYIKEHGDYTISHLDHLNKRKIFHANLTLSYYACFYDSIKIIFSAPQKLLYLEDLVVNLELKELQYIFIKTLNEMNQRSKESYYEPSLTVADYYIYMRSITQEIHTDKLFDKRCQYSAAVFRKIHKIFPNNLFFMPNTLVEKTYEHL